MALLARTAARLKYLAKGGDEVLKALLQRREFRVTLGTEAANAIRMTVQVLDGVGNPSLGVQDVIVDFKGQAFTITDAAAGIADTGDVIQNAADKWFKTDAAGQLVVDVAQGAVPSGTYLYELRTSHGVQLGTITFA